MIVGIDPSLKATAIVAGIGPDVNQYAVCEFGSTSVGDGVRGRIARYEDLTGRVIDWLETAAPIDAIYIEAYSFGSNDASAKYIAEYGGILRFHLVDLCPRIVEVAPMTLKKFATGKGAGKKDMIAAHLTKRYGVMFGTSDLFDAYALYRLGRVAEGLDEAQCLAQRECAEKVKS